MMTTIGKLTVSTHGDREVEVTRVFDAPRHLVYEALTTPALLKRWLLGPPGWTMTECEIEPKIGGAYRYAWRHTDGQTMGMRGICTEVVPPERLVATEHFDQPWYPGEALVSQTLVESDGRTTLTMIIRYDSRETRDMVLKTPMASGMAAGYDRLEELLASGVPAGAGKDR
jgi:uncharacterized protein YndB with AHSA1/START domain